MKEHLQLWYDKWFDEHKGTNLIYARPENPSLDQVHFIRDTIAGLWWADVAHKDRSTEPPPRDDCKETAFVIGEHRSKSVRLPVFLLERIDLGLSLVLRYNFHDWNVSVISETAVDPAIMRGFAADYDERERGKFPNGYTAGRYWGYCYFQGFPEEYQFGPYSENPRKFSTHIGSDYGVFTLLWLLLRDRRSLRHPL